MSIWGFILTSGLVIVIGMVFKSHRGGRITDNDGVIDSFHVPKDKR
jgi:hypothetical protein